MFANRKSLMSKATKLAMLAICVGNALAHSIPAAEANPVHFPQAAFSQPHEANTFLIDFSIAIHPQAVNESLMRSTIANLGYSVREIVNYKTRYIAVITTPGGTDDVQAFRTLERYFPWVQPNFYLTPQGSLSGVRATVSDAGSVKVGASNLAWHLGEAHVPAAWKKATGQGIKVAVVDTGVADIPALQNSIWVRGSIDGNGVDDRDPQNHGTAVATTIAGSFSPFSSVAGVAPDCKLVSLRACDSQSRATDLSIMKAINISNQLGCKVVNIGFNCAAPYGLANTAVHPITEIWFENLKRDNSLAFVPNGNDSRVGDNSGYQRNKVMVGGLGRNGRVWSFSTIGSSTTFSAPAENILCKTRNGVESKDGTSFSSAIVAGIAALAWSARPELNSSAMTDALRNACSPAQHTLYLGHGLPNAERAVDNAKVISNGTLYPAGR
ncbi:MAG: S8 family serine peptidase [Candidatus Obscuribacterales bacterium]|nr:S8 family serine peptidase [Candidatus Obscuribacterales bacterium]